MDLLWDVSRWAIFPSIFRQKNRVLIMKESVECLFQN
jgi:hypothetical protein